MLALIEAERISQIFCLPVMFRAMLDHPGVAGADLSSLRRACYAMAPMPDAQLDRCLAVFDCDFYLLFGQTEMSPTATLFRPEHQLSHPNSEATAEAFADGWFHSGDIGHFDEDGVLWFSHRSKDVIKTGGENVASLEVETAIYDADPNVAEAVVVGLPHARWSEAITAFVVAKPGAEIDEAALLTALKARLGRFKVPKSVVVVASLPKTSTGKIQKNVVRRERAGLYQAPTGRSWASTAVRDGRELGTDGG